MLRLCKLCGEEFEREPQQRRTYCFRCMPPGWQIEWRRGKKKLRRRPAAWSMAEWKAELLDIPADIQRLAWELVTRPGRGIEAVLDGMIDDTAA
jgi:hypothetical protein